MSENLTQQVLELHFWADNFFLSIDWNWTRTIDTLQHQLISLMSSALDNSATYAVFIMAVTKNRNFFNCLLQLHSNE
jgi:hypothetical protein